jgi:uncharacterized phage protein (TIGR01671 family)
MTRLNKYRIWDAYLKIMTQGDGLTVGFTDGKLSKVSFNSKENRPSWRAMDQDLERGNRFFPQEFTGLTDSEGKEVYEGDIVCEKMTSEISFEGGECNVGRVFFAAGTFMIDGDGSLYDHTYSLIPDRLEDYLVIGNIHQNPELLA